MAVPELLAELLLAPGASGYEDPVQAIVRREAEAIGAEISTDVLGTTIATVKGTTGGRTLALFAHADQVGDVGPGRGRATACSRSRSSRTGTRATRAGSACGSRRRPARCAASSSRRTRASSRGTCCGSTSAPSIVSRRSSSCGPAIRSCSTGRRRRCRTAACSRARSTTGSASTRASRCCDGLPPTRPSGTSRSS